MNSYFNMLMQFRSAAGHMAEPQDAWDIIETRLQDRAAEAGNETDLRELIDQILEFGLSLEEEQAELFSDIMNAFLDEADIEEAIEIAEDDIQDTLEYD
jgi:uncharacterized protein YihD (DUF1040 family)